MADLTASAVGGESSPHIVYVLDDDAQVLASILRLLIGSGYEAHAFSEPAQMLDKVKQTLPEVVILDLALGRSDAIDVMRQLAECKFEGKILLVSGRDEATLGDIQRIGERQGLAMLPSLHKPFRASDLKSRLSAQTTVAERSPKRRPINKISVDVVEAIAAGWLELWYQPKIDLQSFLVCGAEALLRARHPDHGVLTPAALIPPAGSPLHQPWQVRHPTRHGGLALFCRPRDVPQIGHQPAGLGHQCTRFREHAARTATDRPTISGPSHRDHRGRGNQRSRLDLPGIHTIEALRRSDIH